MVTADIANSYNRDVFALPGRTTDLQSQGCNNLIKSQQANMITSMVFNALKNRNQVFILVDLFNKDTN